MGDENNINEVLEVAPELRKFSPEQWETSLKMLRSLGFNAIKFSQMITQHPALLNKSREQIETALNKWSTFNLGEKQTLQLLERYPELLELKNFHLLNENLHIVKSFVGQKHGFKVLRNSPNIVSDNSDLLGQKIYYLRDVMKIDPIEVYKSDVFSLDILTLKTRHMFLERLGMYFKKKNRDGDNDAHETKKNPKLSKITDSSDKRFATKVCHVTLDEYETFAEMYKEELEKQEDKLDSRNFKGHEEYMNDEEEVEDDDEIN